MPRLNKKSSLLEKAVCTAEIENLHSLSHEQTALLTYFCAGDFLEDLAEVKRDPWFRDQIQKISAKYSRIAAMI